MPSSSRSPVEAVKAKRYVPAMGFRRPCPKPTRLDERRKSCCRRTVCVDSSGATRRCEPTNNLTVVHEPQTPTTCQGTTSSNLASKVRLLLPFSVFLVFESGPPKFDCVWIGGGGGWRFRLLPHERNGNEGREWRRRGDSVLHPTGDQNSEMPSTTLPRVA